MNNLLKKLGKILKKPFESFVKIKGIYQVTEIDCTSNEAKALCDEGKIEELLDKYSVRVTKYENIVPDVGLAVIAENLNEASPSADFNQLIQYIAVGTDNTAVTAGDTQLGAEVVRKLVATRSRVGGASKNAILLGYTEGNGNTLREVSAFSGDASATPNSGKIMSHSLMTVSVAKTVSIAVFFEITHTLTSS